MSSSLSDSPFPDPPHPQPELTRSVVFRFFQNQHVRLFFLISLYVYVLGNMMSRMGLFSSYRESDPEFLGNHSRLSLDRADDIGEDFDPD